ncbi:MAG: ABC transporter permease subunit [Chitinispirillaceae bacterium]|nr:ABC transporter permease subunit [Chitinispirillaceae bacterium]
MRDAFIVLNNEWRSFMSSDRGLFIVYAVMITGWGFLIATWKSFLLFFAPFWLSSFSVIIAATFANSVFVAERISGSLEILLTSGISRRGILYGKMGFIVTTTMLVGVLCMSIANIVRFFLPVQMVGPDVMIGLSGLLVYLGASFMTAASSAYFSVLLPNPRVLHFINLFIVIFLVSLYSALAMFWPIPLVVLALIIFLFGALFCVLAKREFDGERITKLIIL